MIKTQMNIIENAEDLDKYLSASRVIGNYSLPKHNLYIIGDYITSHDIISWNKQDRLVGLVQSSFPSILSRMDDPTEKRYRDASGDAPYPCIPLDTSSFLFSLSTAMKLYKKINPHCKIVKFVDAGCGVGEKLILADYIFRGDQMLTNRKISVTGIEYSSIFRAVAICQLDRNLAYANVVEGDITTFEYYDKYNIIYAYNPIDGVKGMRLFFKKVLDTAAPGTVCVFHNVHTGHTAMQSLYYDNTVPKYFKQYKDGGIYTIEQKEK